MPAARDPVKLSEEYSHEPVVGLRLDGPPSQGAVGNKPVANMYSAPTQDADVVSQAICGASVIVVEEKGDWVKVRTPDDYPGWMPLSALRRYGPETRLRPPWISRASGQRFRQCLPRSFRDQTPTRAGPALRGAPGSGPRAGENGADGSRSACRTSAPPGFNAVTSILTPAPQRRPKLSNCQALPRPHLPLGGTSSFGFDCSGFTQMLVRRRAS